MWALFGCGAGVWNALELPDDDPADLAEIAARQYRLDGVLKTLPNHPALPALTLEPAHGRAALVIGTNT